MASLEDMIMAGLFGGNVAPGAEDPRRRRPGGAAGGAALFNDFLPLLQGLRTYDFSGARPGQAGLAEALASGGIGPAARHFQRQGGEAGLPPGLAGRDQLPPGLAGREELPPGLDNRLAPGGANVAPGNIDTGRALHQPQGRALGQSQVPRTQGWLNVAPGYAVAASQGYGSKNPIRGAGFQQGPGASGGVKSGGGIPGGPGTGRPPGSAVPGGPGGGPGPSPMTPSPGGGGGGGGFQAPAPSGGGGGGKGRGGKGRSGPSRGPARNTQAKGNRANVRAGTASGGEKVGPKQVSKNVNKKTGGPQTKAGQAVVFGPGKGGPIVEVAPQKGAGGKGVQRDSQQPIHKPPPTPTFTPPTPPPPKPTKGKTKPKPATSGQLR